MLGFATANPGYTFLIIWVIAWAFAQPFKYAYYAYRRRLRAQNIWRYGWPMVPMDADGDIVYPERDEAR